MFVILVCKCVAFDTWAHVPITTRGYLDMLMATALNFSLFAHHQPTHRGEINEKSLEHVGAKRTSSFTSALGDSAARQRLAVTNAAAQHLKTKIPQSQWLKVGGNVWENVFASACWQGKNSGENKVAR